MQMVARAAPRRGRRETGIRMKRTIAIAFAATLLAGSAFADLYRVSYTLRGSGKKITINAESSSEARRVVQDLFPGCYATGAYKVR